MAGVASESALRFFEGAVSSSAASESESEAELDDSALSESSAEEA